MPMCGFNQKMLEGLIAFQEGLVEHGLIERARERGQTPDERLEEELSDMDRFSAEIQRITDQEMKGLVVGLSTFAKAFYRLVRRKGLDDYKKTAQAVNRYFIEMDKKFYGELQGKPGDMRQLTEYLNEVAV